MSLREDADRLSEAMRDFLEVVVDEFERLIDPVLDWLYDRMNK